MATGRLYRRKDRGGEYYALINLGERGAKSYKRKNIRIGAVDAAEAKCKFAEILYKFARNQNGAENNDCLLTEMLSAYFANLDARGTKPESRAGQKANARTIINALESAGAMTAANVNRAQIDRIIADWRPTTSTATINKRLAQLKAIYANAEDAQLIAKNTLARLPLIKNTPKRPRRNLTPDEARALVDVSPEPYKTMWLAYLYTGLRESELINLKTEHIDLKAHVLSVTNSKSTAGRRQIPISKELLSALKRTKPGAVFFFEMNGKQYKRQHIGNQFRKHMRLAISKLSEPNATADKVNEQMKGLDVHALRYTFCTQLVKNGVDIKTTQTLMGHASPQITLKIYAQFCTDNAAEAIKRLRIF